MVLVLLLCKKCVAAIKSAYRMQYMTLRQVSCVVIVELSTAIHICCPMYFLSGSAKIAAAEIDLDLGAPVRHMLEGTIESVK